jgi:hypothetical protein
MVSCNVLPMRACPRLSPTPPICRGRGNTPSGTEVCC